MLIIRSIYSSVRIINSITNNSIKNIKTIEIAIVNNQLKIRTIIKISS